MTQQQDYTKNREEMVKLIEKRGVKDSATFSAMRKIPRHLFLPSGQVVNAYDDRPLPIGHGQTISQPYIVAYMTEIVKLKSHHRVLEIGNPAATRLILSLVVIAGPAFLMGMPFPLGLKALSRIEEKNVPWAWGINSCMSVISAALATLLAVEAGSLW